MESDMELRINTARSLADEIARIGQMNRRRSSGRIAGEVDDGHGNSLNQVEHSHDGAVPVSPPNGLSGKLLKVVVSDQTAKADLCRLNELKQTLLDLCDRQLNDLVDTTPTGHQQDIEDVEKLLAEMRTLRQGMETIVAIQGALDLS